MSQNRTNIVAILPLENPTDQWATVVFTTHDGRAGEFEMHVDDICCASCVRKHAEGWVPQAPRVQ